MLECHTTTLSTVEANALGASSRTAVHGHGRSLCAWPTSRCKRTKSCISGFDSATIKTIIRIHQDAYSSHEQMLRTLTRRKRKQNVAALISDSVFNREIFGPRVKQGALI
ncbi:uncharacterized protein LOC116841609 isoform X2 [Odontomachus brunneus]|uniref:uncharacterized protein LOC116841609 isoform X2 n=1 Tax=Odontomachus brunneus TaxID=486640 RepID=UPI0013F20955|nr:uncharacterized protein LOC116841609 isoform X2 [Odontomachus brunneus]